MKVTYLKDYDRGRVGQIVPICDLQEGEIGKRTSWPGFYRIHNFRYEVKGYWPDEKWLDSDYNNPDQRYNATKDMVEIVDQYELS